MRSRRYIFIIKTQYSKYESTFSKNKAEQIQAFYIKKTDEILDYKSRSTGTNIAREIEQTDNKYNHAIGSMKNYIKPYLKANYYVDDKQWCEINYQNCSYDVISEEQLKIFRQTI